MPFSLQVIAFGDNKHQFMAIFSPFYTLYNSITFEEILFPKKQAFRAIKTSICMTNDRGILDSTKECE